MKESPAAGVLRQSAETFGRLLDEFPDMIHSVDDTGRIVYANRRASELLGYTREELLAMRVEGIYPDEIRAQMESGFARLRTAGNVRVESLLRHRDGTRLPVEIRSFSVYDAEGAFARTFSIVRDLRPIKELQNQLVHAGRLAAIGELSAGVAHDINNPLTVIMIAAESMQNECARGHTLRRTRLESAVRDVLRAAEVIRKISDHLRTFARGVAEQHGPVRLAQVLDDALFITRNRVLSAGVAVEVAVPHEVCVRGAANQLEQVFVNLISNACDALDGHPVRRLRIEATAVLCDGIAHWQCRVADTGPGIPEDARARIFESFFTTKPKGQGTGLGLSICRGIVREHKGAMELERAGPEGTCFLIRLPAEPAIPAIPAKTD